MRSMYLAQGPIEAIVWPDAKRGIAIIPGDFHPSAGEDTYPEWLDMESDLRRLGLTMLLPDSELPAVVAGCEVIEIRLAGAE